MMFGATERVEGHYLDKTTEFETCGPWFTFGGWVVEVFADGELVETAQSWSRRGAMDLAREFVERERGFALSGSTDYPYPDGAVFTE